MGKLRKIALWIGRMMKIGILSIPFNGDGTPPEMENPASTLREAGLSNLQNRIGGRVQEYGDLEIPVHEGIRDSHTKVLNLEAWKQISRKATITYLKKRISVQSRACNG